MHPEGNTPNNQSQRHIDQPTPGRAESHEAGVSSAGVSATTQSLIDLLRRRDAAGRAKYGTTLDRTDLSVAEWTQHAVEELLDAAGYLLARQRTDDQASAPVGVEGLASEWEKRAGELNDEGLYGCCAETYEQCAAQVRALAQQPAAEPKLVFGLGEAKALVEFFGGSNTAVVVQHLPAGQSTDDDGQPNPAGLYAWCDECPEEGSVFLGPVDTDTEEYDDTPQQPDASAPATAKFTDSARAAIAWVLYHHQGARSPVGQPLRYALGLGRHEPLSDFQIAEAQAWAAWASATTADFHRQESAAVDEAWIDVREQLPPNGQRVEVLAASVRHGGKHSTTWAIGTTSVTHWRALACKQLGDQA